MDDESKPESRKH